MVTGAQIVDAAKARLGQAEVPLGSNRGPFVQLCQACTFLAGTGWPWCAAFVCFICKHCGVPLAYNGAGAHDLADHHKPWVHPTDAEPGMVLDVNEGSGHTCIIAHVDHAHRSFTTIDGNWADRVSQVTTHTFDQARAIWKIPGVTYQSGKTPAKPAPKRLPAWLVTTSKSGHKKLVFRAKTKKGLFRYLGTHNLARLFPNGITIHRGKAT